MAAERQDRMVGVLMLKKWEREEASKQCDGCVSSGGCKHCSQHSRHNPQREAAARDVGVGWLISSRQVRLQCACGGKFSIMYIGNNRHSMQEP